MKRSLIIIIAVLGLLLGLVVPTQMVHAQSTREALMTEAHVERIRQNCTRAQATLERLDRNNDRPLRVNRGQMYNHLLDGLMVPLNNRMALNGFNNVEQARIVVVYRDKIAKFGAAFRDYSTAMKAATTMNCQDQPVAFYDAVVALREKRQQLHRATQEVNQEAINYQTAAREFTRQLEAAQ